MDKRIKILLFCIAPLGLLAEDYAIVASTLILEAGGEYAEGAMEAVNEVIHNRSIKRSITPTEVCLQPWQFSCWNNGNTEGLIIKAQSHPRYEKALKIVKGERTNLTNGADHYHADYVNPYWAESMTITIKIGQHIFYK